MAFAARSCPFSVALCGLALLALPFAGSAKETGPARHPHRPLVVFLSDFGTLDDAVAICKGVMLTVAPDVEVIDLTHQVTPYSIADGARLLASTAPYYRAGTLR